MLLRELRHKSTYEQRDIIFPRTQWRQIYAQHVESIIQIGAEAALFDVFAQRTIRGGNDAHVDGNRLHAANARHLTLLEHTQQLHLRAAGHFADLVKKQRAGVGQLESSESTFGGACECAFFVPEEFALEQRLRQRADIDRDKRFRATRTETVNGARDEFLACSAFAFDQHRTRDRRDLLNLDKDFANRLGFTDQSGQLREPQSIESTTQAVDHLAEFDRLRPRLHVADVAKTILHGRITDIRETDDRHTVPQLLAHERDIRGVEQRSGQHENIRRGATQVTAHIVHRRNGHGVVAERLERGVEPYRRLDIAHENRDDAERALAGAASPHGAHASACAHALAGLL